jgi:outer membrane protein assembly factor BamB
VVHRVRSLTIALVIATTSCALSGQQPKSSREPYVAPVLPADEAWAITLPSSPSAAAVMDGGTIYVPLGPVSTVSDDGEEVLRPAVLVAVDRESGSTRWTLEVSTRLPPLLTNGLVLVASDKDLQAIDPATGERRWSFLLDRPARAPLIARGSLVLGVLEGGELLAFDVVRREIAWRTPIGAESTGMTADDRAAYVVDARARTARVMLASGNRTWERQLQGELSEPMVDRDRVFVGSNSQLGSLWALDVETGDIEWVWQRGVFGGSITGTAAAERTLYVLSRDMMLRSLARENGNQRWQKAANARVTMPPQLLEGVVIVPGENPTLSTFRADTGAPISTWNGPANAILQGAPLVDTPKPLRVSIVALFRDGRLVALRPTTMLFEEPALAPLQSLPGRPLPRER